MRQRPEVIKQIEIFALALTLLLPSLIGRMDGKAQAQSWPTKPVRVIVPFPPGGTVDIFTRIMTQKLSENVGQQFVVENRGGASGTIAGEAVAKAPPDGYTFIVGGPPDFVTVQYLLKQLPYDPSQDFAPISLMAVGPNVLVVHPSVPANSVKELIALAKAKPGTINFASGGIGNTSHLSGELFKQLAGIDIVHVPYKGNAAAANDLVGGHVQMLFESTISSAPRIQAKKVRALAVTANKRTSSLPNIPTFAEAGLPGMEVYIFFCIQGPKKTPKDVIAKLNKEIDRVLQQLDVADKLKGFGLEPVLGSTPEQLAAFLKDERTKWKKVIEEANIKME